MLLSVEQVSAQKGWILGVQYRPLIPNTLSVRDYDDFEGSKLNGSVTPSLGNSFGMVIRYNFTKNIALETAVNLIQRKHRITLQTNDGTANDESVFGIRSYELPIEGLYYVRLADRFYMNIMSGISFNFFPSDVQSIGDNDVFEQLSLRREWVQLSLLANVGFEYRTDENGYLYLGASFHRPFNVLYRTYIYERLGLSPDASTTLRGTFTSIDIRYFFPLNSDKTIRGRSR